MNNIDIEDRARLYEAAQTLTTLANSGANEADLMQALAKVRDAIQQILRHGIMADKKRPPVKDTRGSKEIKRGPEQNSDPQV